MIQYIKKIDITRFRSIGKMEISVDHITIFSGRNNSGKSNILKALNLFFNEETSFHTKYNYDIDYNKYFKGKTRGVRRVTIKVWFKGNGKGALKNDFWINREFGDGTEETRSYGSEDENTMDKIKKGDGNITRQFTKYFNKINYVYIPAIRDRNFIKYLFQLFEDIIRADTANGKLLNKSVNEISEILQSKSSDISDNFSKFIGLSTGASLSSNMKDILGTVTINVENQQIPEKYKSISSVDIFSSGDGILMSYIMYFIAYMSSKISNKYYIWGFEEPETALEYAKVQSLAETFYSDFSEKAQIFITTHSPAFINLKEKPHVTFYRVYQDIGKDQRLLTHAQTLQEIEDNLFSGILDSENYKLLQEELNMIEQAQEIEDVVKRLQEQQKQNSIEQESIKKQLADGYPQKVFICEDKKAVEVWKILLNDESITVISSCGCGKKDIESQIENLMTINKLYSPDVFRTVDRDGYTTEQMKFIESEINKKYKFNYQYKILPVCEIENFALIENTKITEEVWLSKKDGIRNAFGLTAENNLATMRKIYPESKLFGANNQFTSTINRMFQAAEKNWKYFINGKSLIDGLHYDKYLQTNPPTALTDLIVEIKKFMNKKQDKE
jgi:predicted ATPase